MKLNTICLASVAIASATLSQLKAQNYTFLVAECGGYTVIPEGMNNEGTVVGEAHMINSAYSLAFIYASGACKTVGPGKDGISFAGVTDNNDIIGLHSGGNFLLSHGTVENLPAYPGGEYTGYCCLDTATGVLAGNYDMDNFGEQVGFLYSNGNFVSLPFSNEQLYFPKIAGMNSKGVVVGTRDSLGFTYIDGKIKVFQYPGATYTTFNGISDNGIVVGTYNVRKTGKIGIFSYDLETDTWTDLNFPPDYVTVIPVGITNSGVIAALYSSSGGLVIATPTN
jgi:uncharacterized membrane protein